MTRNSGNLTFLLCIGIIGSLLLCGFNPAQVVLAQDHEGTLITTSDGNSTARFIWDGTNVGASQRIDLKMNKAWDIKDALLSIRNGPFFMEDDGGHLVEVYPEDVEVSVGDGAATWRFNGKMGEQVEFEHGGTSVLVPFTANDEKTVYFTLPLGADIDDIKFNLNNTMSGQFDYKLYAGNGDDLIWNRSSIHYSQDFSIPTKFPIEDVCVDHLDLLFDSYNDIVSVGDNGTLYWHKHDDMAENNYKGNREIVGQGPEFADVLSCDIGDFDQDISNDVVLSTNDGHMYVYKNVGFGVFEVFSDLHPATNRIETVVMDDINHDGWGDVVGGYLTGELLLSTYDSDNETFKDPITVPVGLEAINDIFIGDMNLDSYSDIVGASNDNNWWYLQSDNGAGLKDPVRIRSGGSDLTSLTVVDVNFDNSPDLISGSLDGNVYVSYNLGSTFDDGIRYSGGQASMKDIVSEDLDHDGDYDILGLNADGWVYLLKNEFGFLQNGTRLIEVGKEANSIALGDLDMDNDPDMVIGGEDGLTFFKNELGPFNEMVGHNDGGALSKAISEWLENHPDDNSSIEFQDEYGITYVRIPIKIESIYPGALQIEDLLITYELTIDVQLKDALNGHITLNRKKADPLGFLNVPVKFKNNGVAGIIDLDHIMIGYDEGFMTVITSPPSHQVVYNSNDVELACGTNEDPYGSSDENKYQWNVDGRSLGEGAKLTIKGSQLGGYGNHTVECVVTNKKTAETSESEIFIQLDPNSVPKLKGPENPRKATVNKEYHVQVFGEDHDPWDQNNLTYSLEAAPNGVSLEPRTGFLSWIPTALDVGTHLIAIRLSDGKEFTNLTMNIVVERGHTVTSLSYVSGPYVWLLVAMIMVAFGLFLGGTEVGIYAFFSLVFLLYTRLKKEKILDNFLRGRIYGHISQNPGLHFSELKRKLDLPNGSLTYHLKTLEREGLIISFPNGTHRVFYPASMKVPKDHLTLSKAQRWILEVVRDNPGISQKKISKETGLSTSTVSRIVIDLEKRGHMRTEKGRKSKCYIVKKEDT